MDGFVIQEQKEPWKGVMVQERHGVGADWSWLEKLVEVGHREPVQEALKRAVGDGRRWCLAAEAALKDGWNGDGFYTTEIAGWAVRLVLADVMVRTTVTVDERLAPWP